MKTSLINLASTENMKPIKKPLTFQNLHRLPWFLYGAGISTISTVFLYFHHRPQPRFYTKSSEPPRI